MDGLNQGGLFQDITVSLIPTDLFEVEAKPSCQWMKYHAYRLK